MRLTGSQIGTFTDALGDAYSVDELVIMVRSRLDKDIEDIVSLQKAKPTVLFELVGWAERRDRVFDLLNAARASNQTNARLTELAGELGLAAVAPSREVLERQARGENVSADIAEWRAGLESQVRRETNFQDFPAWLARFGALETKVCRVEVLPFDGRNEIGTGFLVGPDLVLTNHHVVEKILEGPDPLSPKRVRFRFDYKRTPDNREVNEGREFQLDYAGDWMVAKSPPSDNDGAEALGVPDAGHPGPRA